MERIDSHLHVNFSGFTSHKIIDYLDQHKLDACWLLTWDEQNPPIPKIYRHLPFEDINEAKEQYPERIIPFCAFDPRAVDSMSRMQTFFQKGGAGCGELKVAMEWDDKKLDPYLSLLNEKKSALVIHMEYPHEFYMKSGETIPEKIMFRLMTSAFKEESRKVVRKISNATGILKNHIQQQTRFLPGYLHDFDKLASRIEQFPNIKFIGHGPHFWNHFSSNTNMYYIHNKGKVNGLGRVDEFLEKYDNFYCDISGNSGFNALNRDLNYTQKFLDKHSSKILFGSDNTPHDFIGLLNSMKLSSEQMKRIMGQNALQLMLE